MSAIDRATFAGRWRSAVAAVGDRPFLIWEDSAEQVTTWTYADFDELVACVAGRLVSLGAGPGHPVHLALANSPAFVACWLAAARIGAVMVPSDPRASTRELRDAITRTNPAVGVCAKRGADDYAGAARGVPTVLTVEEDDVELGDLRSQPITADGSTRPGDALAVLFTSGTTSAPKGVLVTQANYAFTGTVMAAAAGLRAEDRQLVVLPMFHANAQYYSFAAAISAGASVALMSGFSATRFIHQAARHAATHASLFAAPIRMILARGAEAVPGYRLQNVWFAQNVSHEQYDAITALLGCRPRQLYGMTETIPAVLTNRAIDPVPASMGVPTLGCAVDVWEPESRKSVADGEVGEVVVGGTRGITLFDGYLDDPATTEAAFDRRWFRTGDLATRDGDGRLYFAGRSSDVIEVAGENVSAVEVEGVLAEHPGVLEAAVVGVPDPVRDEVPVAFVVRVPMKEAVTEHELASHSETHLAPSKRPRAVYFVDELPRTSVGKIRKFILKEAAARTGHHGAFQQEKGAELRPPAADIGCLDRGQ